MFYTLFYSRHSVEDNAVDNPLPITLRSYSINNFTMHLEIRQVHVYLTGFIKPIISKTKRHDTSYTFDSLFLSYIRIRPFQILP